MAHRETREAAAEWVGIDAVHPWAENPRKNDKAIDKVADSIKRLGWGSPIIARKADGEIIAGHTRYAAALKLGFDKIPVRFVDLDPGDAHLLALADNRLGEIAEWDDAGVRALLAGLDDEERALAGWSESEAREVLGIVDAPDADPFASLPTDTPEFRSMTFTVTHDQHAEIEDAIRRAKAIGPFVDTGNENSNGNALARICEMFHA